MNLTEKLKRMDELNNEIREIRNTADDEIAKRGQEIAALKREVKLDSALINTAKVDLARSVIFVRGVFANAGQDRVSVVTDAIETIATGQIPRGCESLNLRNYGTKSYAHWHGQRCDNKPFCGPRHGTIIFQIGITDGLRERGGVNAMTDEEREAALYLLTRLEAIQSAEAQAAA